MRTALVMLVAAVAPLSLIACSYSVTFAVANETEEHATLFVILNRQGERCPPTPRLASAPVEQLRRGWFRGPSPDWSPLPVSSFVYSSLDCSVSVPVPAQQSVSVTRMPNTSMEPEAWEGDFPIKHLRFTSSSHRLDLEGPEAVLREFKKRAELLYVLAVSQPAAGSGPVSAVAGR